MVCRQDLYTEKTAIKDITDGSKYKDIIKTQSQRQEKPDIHLTFTMNTGKESVSLL